jgi:hypothetical protein
LRKREEQRRERTCKDCLLAIPPKELSPVFFSLFSAFLSLSSLLLPQLTASPAARPHPPLPTSDGSVEQRIRSFNLEEKLVQLVVSLLLLLLQL